MHGSTTRPGKQTGAPLHELGEAAGMTYNAPMNEFPHLATFLDNLASGEPTPGGGSAAALAGALGAALAAMVANLTVGRKRYVDVDDLMQAVLQEAEALRGRLTGLVAEDAQAYEQVRAAYRLPKESAADQAARNAAIQSAMQAASLTPLETMRACIAVLRLAEQAVTLGNVNAATDGAVGALLAQAGLRGAALNVRINLRDVDDPAFVAASEQTVTVLQTEADAITARVLAAVEARLAQP
jgi:methenyltetrahydrofolate cyclohydrolase